MFVWPTPLLFAVFGRIVYGDGAGTLFAAAAFTVLTAGAWFLREGLRAERAYDARAVARRPRIPRKIVAALAAGLGVALAQLAQTEPAAGSALGFGVLALVTHLLAFGIDPLANKGIDLSDAEADRVAGVVAHAEETLAGIEADARAIGDREITRRLTPLVAEVRAMLARIEAEPRELEQARRYLSVHLVGAREATRKYAESAGALDDPRLRADYLALLSELEASFARGRDKMLDADRTDLELEIEVLRDRLGREHA